MAKAKANFGRQAIAQDKAQEGSSGNGCSGRRPTSGDDGAATVATAAADPKPNPKVKISRKELWPDL
jgi:hypothetical protein